MNFFNPIKNGLLTDGAEREKALSLQKFCHMYPAIMKIGKVIPYLRKIKKKY